MQHSHIHTYVCKRVLCCFYCTYAPHGEHFKVCRHLSGAYICMAFHVHMCAYDCIRCSCSCLCTFERKFEHSRQHWGSLLLACTNLINCFLFGYVYHVFAHRYVCTYICMRKNRVCIVPSLAGKYACGKKLTLLLQAAVVRQSLLAVPLWEILTLCYRATQFRCNISPCCKAFSLMQRRGSFLSSSVPLSLLWFL